jgi:hypothetical protein
LPRLLRFRRAYSWGQCSFNGGALARSASPPKRNGAALSEARKFRRQIGGSQSGLRFNGAPKRGVHCMNVENKIVRR